MATEGGCVALAIRALRDFNTQHLEFTMDPRSAPKRILQGQLRNELPHLLRNAWSPPPSFRLGKPGPEPPKPFALPSHHSFRLNKQERVAPPWPHLSQSAPEQAIRGGQHRTFSRAAISTELESERSILDCDGFVATPQKSKEPKQAQGHGRHGHHCLRGSQ
jgi:hypothetical protein